MRVQKLGQMRISKFSAYILWIISILWFGLCLFLSWQVGEDTVRLSEGMAQNIRRVIQLFGYEVEITSLHMFLRKSAHMAVFFVAGVLCTFSLRKSLPENHCTRGISAILSTIMCGLVAVIAEMGKAWIPGRHLQWDETLLDVFGAVCGAGIIWATGSLRRWKSKRTKEIRK